MNAYVFIDASNLWQAQKARGWFLDYGKLQKFLKDDLGAASIEIFYYTAYPREGTCAYSMDGRHKFLTFLKKGLGFVVRKKELKRISITTEAGERIEEKGNMDVEITIDALHNLKRYDTAIFFTGDSDFLALVTYLRRGGKKVYVFSSRNNISEELRTGADGYRDLLMVQADVWGRALQHRPDHST